MAMVPGLLRFVVALPILCYAPGHLALHPVRRSLSPLEDLTLSCIVGLLASSCAYWVFGFIGRPDLFFLWPLLATAGFAVVHRRLLWRLAAGRRGLPEHSREGLNRSHLLLLAVLAVGVGMLAVLPSYYQNLTPTPDGGVHAFPIDDAIFHLAMANELTHAIPPESPIFSGYPLNYHFGSDLAVAMFARAALIDVPDLSLRFIPTLVLVLSMLTVFCFSRRWLGSGSFAALATLLVFFGEDLSFIPGFILGEKSNWSVVYFQVPAVLSLFYHNPMLPGLGLLFAGLFCLQAYVSSRSSTWLMLTAALFAALLEVKVFTAMQVIGSLGLAGVFYLAAFRDARLLKAAACTAALALPLVAMVFIHNRQGARIGVDWNPWPYVPEAMSALGLTGRVHGLAGFVLIGLPIYLVGSLGLRLAGLPRILAALLRPKADGGLRFMMAAFVVGGIVATLTCRVGPKNLAEIYNNSVWFFAQSKYVAWLFAVEAIRHRSMRMASRPRLRRWAAPAFVAVSLALSLPSTVQHFDWLLTSKRSDGSVLFSPGQVAAARFLARNANAGDVVLCEPSMLRPILGLSRCRVPVWDYALYMVPVTVYRERVVMQRSFWSAWNGGAVRQDILDDLHIRYIAILRGAKPVDAGLPPRISSVYSNAEISVLAVAPLRPDTASQ